MLVEAPGSHPGFGIHFELSRPLHAEEHRRNHIA
jgi:hypothetical protein